jgi:uncharacterized membrane protein
VVRFADTRARQSPQVSRPLGRRHELAQVLRRKRRLRSGVVQLIAATVAVALGVTVPSLDLGYQIPSNHAVEMLVAVAAGTVTFIGVVFSLLFLVVQFGSTTFTPRLNLFRDAPIVWRAFAFYTGVVVYAFTAALTIGRDEQTPAAVPLLAFTGVILSIWVYRRLQTTAFTWIQLASTLEQVEVRGRDVIDGLYTSSAPSTDQGSPVDERPEPDATSPRAPIRWPHRGNVVQVIDVPRLLRAAQRADVRITLQVASGRVVSEGAVVATVTGPADQQLVSEVLGGLIVGGERTFEQDPELALRLLADIALRALSPAINDPTTAVQALDRIDSLLRALATRDLDIQHVTDDDGLVRVDLVLPTWEAFVGVALDEILALDKVSPAVTQRITRLLDDISAIAPPGRRPALAARRAKLREADATLEGSR